MGMTYEIARDVVDAMRSAAKERGVPSAYAVVDEGGNLVVFAVDDGAILAARELAINKAWTALAIGESTSGLATQVQPGQDFHGLAHSVGRPLVTFAGGQPLGSPLIGGCGVSGGDLDDDEAISLAGQKAIAAATAADDGRTE